MSRDKVKKEGFCRLCGRSAKVRPLTRHHLIPQRWFISQPPREYRLRNAAANVVPLCRPCHDLVEDEMLVRSMLRRKLLHEEEEFILNLKGRVWLNRVYPYWTGDDRTVLEMIDNAPYHPPRKRMAQPKEVKMVHKYGCDPINGCVGGCPVAAKYRTFYPLPRAAPYR